MCNPIRLYDNYTTNLKIIQSFFDYKKRSCYIILKFWHRGVCLSWYKSVSLRSRRFARKMRTRIQNTRRFGREDERMGHHRTKKSTPIGVLRSGNFARCANIPTPCAWQASLSIFERRMRTRAFTASRKRRAIPLRNRKKRKQHILRCAAFFFWWSGRLNVRTICHIFNFFGRGDIYRVVIKG